jgi:hypothetical protein
MMTKSYVTADELKKAADYLASTKEEGGCYHWKVATKNKMNICIVLGWSPAFDKEKPDKYYDDGYRLAVKIAYQSANSIMQCDYDIDWQSPRDQFNDDTWAEYGIYPTTNFEALAKDTNSNADWTLEHWKELGHE